MKALFTTVLAVLCILGSSTSVAQGTVSGSVRYNLPVVETSKNLQGEEVKCLNVNQWKTVQLIANEYHGLYDWRLQIEGVLKTHEQMISTYEQMLKNYEQVIKFQNQDREYLTLRLNQEIKAAKSIKLQDKIEKVGLWAIVVVETLTLGILGARMVIVNQ